MKNKDISESEQIKLGNLLAQVFHLKRDVEHPDRYRTNWGTKTAKGVYLVACRIINEPESLSEYLD